MPCMQITITATTGTPVDLYTLLMKGTNGIYTCSPAAGINPSDPIGSASGHASYLSIQADPTNTSTTYIYKGDSRVSSSCYGKSLLPGVIDVQESDYNAVHLKEIYLWASTASLKVNIEAHFE